jgi:hypothetical protein
MMERYGVERFLLESGAQLIHSDQTGALYRKELPDDEPLVMVHVVNSTPEPDGSLKKYMLRVHPQIRPLLGNDRAGRPRFGPPQKMTAHNAVASLHGLRGEDYRPGIET